jgi:hypothetical protein
MDAVEVKAYVLEMELQQGRSVSDIFFSLYLIHAFYLEVGKGKVKVKVKQSRYRPGVAQRVPGR